MIAQEIKNRREFEAELLKLSEELRQTIELECEAFELNPAASKARAKRAFSDYKFFCETYFPHYVPTAHFSSFHEFVFLRLPKIIDGEADGREVWQAPRGEAKSTYVTQLGALWCIVTNRKHMIAIIMDTEEQAIRMLESIKAELDSNPRLGMDFPKACGQGRTWQATGILTANNIKVSIGGTGKKLRGMKHGPHRPDLILLDDLENDENVREKAQREKVENFVMRAVLGLAGPSGGMDVFWVGTSLHYDAAINRVSRKAGWRRKVFKAITQMPDNMALWDKWEALYRQGIGLEDTEEKAALEEAALAFYQKHEKAMKKGAELSWGAVRGLYKLMTIRAGDHDAFAQEYQNEAGNDEDAPFRSITFWTDWKNDWVFFGAIDPSLGKRGKSGRGGDPSAILVGGFDRKNMRLDVVEADICRRTPDMIIARAIALQKEFQCLAWAVEAVQFQAFLCSELIKQSAAQGVAFPAVPVIPLVDKELRIISLQPHVKNGLIRLGHNQATLLEQLKFWPEADHDDGPDALEMLYTLSQQYAGDFGYTSAGGRRGAVQDLEGWEDD